MNKLQEQRMIELINIINKANKEYYTDDNPSLTDAEYDAYYDELIRLEKESGTVLPNSPSLRVGGEVLKEFKKHTHLSRLYSLDKATNINQLTDFLTKTNYQSTDKKYSAEYKFDGITVVLTYKNGRYVKAATRGNGVIGEDVTEQVKTINSFPLEIDYKGTIEVHGEAIMRLSSLQRYNKNNPVKLSNARNAAAGAVRNLDPKETKRRNLDIFFYSVNFSDKNFKSQREQLEFLKNHGFNVCDFVKYFDTIDELKEIIDNVSKVRSTLDFLIDGIVIKVNDVQIREKFGYTDKFPRWAIAYKFEAENAIVRLKDVEWQVGRTGRLTPLAILEPVELAGVVISRATLNNMDDIKRKNIKIGDDVLLRRSNDVIPEILKSVQSFESSKEVIQPKNCPVCGSNTMEKGAHLFCTNSNCPAVLIGKFEHIASEDAFDIEGLSTQTAGLLISKLGLKETSEIFKLKKSDLIGLDGFKDKKINNLINSIEKSKNIKYENFIYALGIDGVGSVLASELAKRFATFEDLTKSTISDLINIPMVGDIMAKNIVDYFANNDNIRNIKQMFENGVTIVYKNVSIGGKLKDINFVITGTLSKPRSYFEKLIKDNGGIIHGSVSKSTNYLLVGEDAGSKLEKAKKLGIQIIDEAQFLAMI